MVNVLSSSLDGPESRAPLLAGRKIASFGNLRMKAVDGIN